MRLRTILELFGRHTDYEWVSASTARFQVGYHQYYVSFDTIYLGKIRGAEVSFELDYDGDGFGITGTGNAAAVFGMVLHIIRDYAQPDVQFLLFQVDEPNRLRLYQAMFRRLGRDWQLITDSKLDPNLTLMFLVSKRTLPDPQQARALYRQLLITKFGHRQWGVGELSQHLDGLSSDEAV